MKIKLGRGLSDKQSRKPMLFWKSVESESKRDK